MGEVLSSEGGWNRIHVAHADELVLSSFNHVPEYELIRMSHMDAILASSQLIVSLSHALGEEKLRMPFLG